MYKKNFMISSYASVISIEIYELIKIQDTKMLDGKLANPPAIFNVRLFVDAMKSKCLKSKYQILANYHCDGYSTCEYACIRMNFIEMTNFIINT